LKITDYRPTIRAPVIDNRNRWSITDRFGDHRLSTLRLKITDCRPTIRAPVI